jgi:hypothetical protein
MRGWEKCRDLILISLPANIGVLRFHVSGDFFKLAYLRGAIEVAKARPDVLFYAYTKSLHLIDQLYKAGISLPANFIVTASEGGKYDHLINTLGLRTAVVVHSEDEAKEQGLPIDHDDSHAATPGGSFALLIHGTQPKGSEASKALSALRGKGSYSR